MKILAISDQVDPLIYTPNAKQRFADVDLILFAGDLRSSYIDFVVSVINKPAYFVFGNHDLQDFHFYHKVKSAQSGAHPTNMFEQDIFSKMYETHNCGATYAGFKVLRSRTLKIENSKGKKSPLLIAGATGTLKYNKGLAQYTEREMFWNLFKMVPSLLFNKIRYGRYCDIFLTHASPRHIHDKEDLCHKGFECFNWFIRHFKPRFLIHGHIHLYDLNTPRVTKSEETTVINCFSHYLFDFESGEELNSICPT